MTTYLERYAELAKRLISTTGGEALLALSPELQLGLTLEGLDVPPEYAALMGIRPFICSSSEAAPGAGNFNCLMVAAPASQITVITHISCDVIAGFGIATPVAGTLVTALSRDQRQIASPPATRFFRRTAVGAALLPASGGYMRTAILGLQAIPPFVLAAGGTTNFILETTTNNVASVLGVAGYERAADPHEIDATVR